MKLVVLLGTIALLPVAWAATTTNVIVANNTFTDEGTGTLATIITVGDTIDWTNIQGVHTVSSLDGTTMRSTGFGPGEVYSTTFEAPGAFPYRCGFHPTMIGLVIVQPSV